MNVNQLPDDSEQGSESSHKTSGIEGNPYAKEGKISYGDTSEDLLSQTKLSDESTEEGEKEMINNEEDDLD